MTPDSDAKPKTPPARFPGSFLIDVGRAVQAREGQITGNEMAFRCPFPGHNDVHPSARWNVEKATFFCNVCAKGGGALDLADLLGVETPGDASSLSSQNRVAHSYAPDLTVAMLAEAKQLGEGFLRACGVSDVKYQGGPAVRIVYRDSDASDGAIRYRTHLYKPPSGDRFRWRAGAKPRLYGLDRLKDAQEVGYVWLVEGESCCWTCWQESIPAIGVPGAAMWNDDRDADHFDGIAAIFAVVEPDDGGQTFRKKITNSRICSRIHLVDLSPFGVKDISELYLSDRVRFPERLDQAKKNAVPLANIAAAEIESATNDAFADAYELVNESDILRLVRGAMRDRGYAGSLDAPLLAYLAITSAHLAQPLNMAFIAPSGAGKNRAVDEGRAFAPKEQVYEVKAGSARALIYNDASFEHRVVLFSEADSIPEDGPAASAVRSIASDNEMRYETVERDESTGKWSVRIISKPGPTALLTTSTRSLRNQFDTRVLEIPIPDDADQTRAVMRAHAVAVMPGLGADIDLKPFIALQRWFELAGEKRVAVPFAEALAGLLPAGAVRMRRDFRQLLTVIQTIAFIHQHTRERTPEGWVIATATDYASARALLAPIFDVSTSEGVTPPLRQVVAAISETEEVSLSTLAERLKLAKTTISWRTSRAIRGGWLVNNETRKGQPARFARGTPLPDEVSALPTPEALMSPYERPTRFREGAEPLPSQPGNVVSLHRVSDSSLAATDTDDNLDEWVTI